MVYWHRFCLLLPHLHQRLSKDYYENFTGASCVSLGWNPNYFYSFRPYRKNRTISITNKVDYPSSEQSLQVLNCSILDCTGMHFILRLKSQPSMFYTWFSCLMSDPIFILIRIFTWYFGVVCSMLLFVGRMDKFQSITTNEKKNQNSKTWLKKTTYSFVLFLIFVSFICCSPHDLKTLVTIMTNSSYCDMSFYLSVVTLLRFICNVYLVRYTKWKTWKQ